MISFCVLKTSKHSRARLGILKTPHGEVETPTLVPVATQATIKTLTAEETREAKCRILIANTYHLHIRPGEAVVKKAGGLHKFMDWRGPMMTDSGGFQVFSLGFGKDLGMGKILKKRVNTEIGIGQQPKLIKITPAGVYFRSYVDGKQLFIGPKESIRIQEALGADIMFAFDECTSPAANHEYTKRSMLVTHRWAKTCLEARCSKQALYGIVQGGKFEDLRRESAKVIGAMDFDGFGIGGEFGDDKRKMVRMLGWVIDELPEEKPRHILGIGHPEDIPAIIKAGADMFDCIAPTHYGRRGVAFTSYGRVDLSRANFLSQHKRLDPKCACMVCETYSRSYLSHLIRAYEITGLRLLTFHNLYYFNMLVEKVRRDIKRGRI